MVPSEFWIHSGTVVTGTGVAPASVLVRGEKIAAVVPVTQAPEREPAIDAAGLWLLPGGVDAHVHFGMPLRDGIASLGWRESSQAALLGGTTTVIDFANPDRDESLASAVTRWRAAAAADCLCDHGLHTTICTATAERLAEIPRLVDQGIPTFKAFLAYKDRLMLTPAELRLVMQAVARAGGRLLVHAEDGELNAAAEERLLTTGRSGPEWHRLAHPAEAELGAIRTTLELARTTGCAVTIVHVSLAGSLDLLRQARAAGNIRMAEPGCTDLITAEVCLHHIFASSGHCQGSHEAFLRAVLSPPIREVHDSQQLLAGLQHGELDILSTDHCEFPLAVKAREARRGFNAIPNGAGGVGERLTLAYAKGVVPGLLDAARWVRVCCERPAELMGLAGCKGRIAPGHDADLVLFDPEAEGFWQPLGASDPASNLYAGTPVRGAVCKVWRRGELVVSGGNLQGGLVPGRFLERRFRTPA